VPQPALPLEATDAGREPAPGILHARLLRELLSHALPGMREGPAQDGQAGRRKPALLPPAEPLRKRSSEMAGKIRFRGATLIDSTGLKIGLEGDRPTSHCLRGWWWGGDGDRDHSLYDRDGLTIARIVLQDDGRYHLQKPIAIPRQAWAHLEEAKRGAESFALMAMPLEAVDPKLAARIKRGNETPHPMGRRS